MWTGGLGIWAAEPDQDWPRKRAYTGMADRLSQLQTCLDQLVTQFFSSLNYINKHHDFSVPRGTPAFGTKVEDPQQEVLPAEQFDAALAELSKDIVTKARQIEVLIGSLPELESTTAGNFEALEQQLQEARAEEAAAAAEREVLLRQCDDLVMKVAESKRELDKAPR